MSDDRSATSHDDLIRRLAAATRAVQLYAATHPLVGRTLADLLTALEPLRQNASVTIGIIEGSLVVGDTPVPRASAAMPDLIARLTKLGIERIAIDAGVTASELLGFLGTIARSAPGGAATAPEHPHIRVGRLTQEDRESGGVAGDMTAIRRLYATAVGSAEGVWESAAAGTPDLAMALETVENMADAVTRNRTALVALTAMRSYDAYTFTHMVNVSILTMAQARALGIEGRLLREIGLAALMHDIGKVRTPKDILNKPERLTDDELEIMRRHVIDGAEILRCTPEMPALAPVVALEHHLRLDGSGYPVGVRREALNLATMMCSIADVYDAMRSHRAYQESQPAERIVAVLQNTERSQFDMHLVRRFIRLLGLYPPGSVVRLISGEIAVVTRVHAPDPARPRVRLVLDARGGPVPGRVERNLWQAENGVIAATIDPRTLDLDPLTYVSAEPAQPAA